MHAVSGAEKSVLWACRKSSLSVRPPYLSGMNYILAILLPPVSILLTGRPILGIIVFFIWVPAIIFSGGLTHPMFILLAWLIIFQSREDRRSARDLRERR